MTDCPSCNRTVSPGTTLCRFCGASIPDPAATTVTADVEREVRSLLDQGLKIEAIKFYRNRSGMTLYDAQRSVEQIAARRGITEEAGGCSGVLVATLVALIALAVLATLTILRQ